MSTPIPTLEELTALCREWQERLRLQDWRVRVRYSREFELDGEPQARISTRETLKSALIVINPFVENGPDYAFNPIETRIIHELLHLHWEVIWNLSWGKDGPQYILAEQAIELTAWALYRAKYGDKPGLDPFLEVEPRDG